MQKLDNTDKLAVQLAEYRLEALRAQMNPHFIFNSITAIQHFILNNEKLAALSYLDEFTALIRKFLNHSRSPKVSVSEELELLIAYINLENLRFGDKFGLTLHIDERLDIDAIQIPSMLIQPLVENSIKHGLMHKKDGYGLLQIRFEADTEQTIKITIEDNGIGRKKSAEINQWRPKEHKSVGMDVTRQRLDILTQVHGITVGMLVEDLTENDEAKGTRITLTTPII